MPDKPVTTPTTAECIEWLGDQTNTGGDYWSEEDVKFAKACRSQLIAAHEMAATLDVDLDNLRDNFYRAGWLLRREKALNAWCSAGGGE